MIYSEFIKQTICNDNQIQWNYYNSDLDVNDILQSENSKNFIYDYFENGAKTLYHNDVLPQTIIDAIDLEYRPGSKELKISCLSNDVDIHRIYSKAKELEDWTSVKCSGLRNRSFTLKL